MSLPVTTTPEADTQIRVIDGWWRENRPASPELFLDELSLAFEVIGRAPLIGRLYRRSPVPGTTGLIYQDGPHAVRRKTSTAHITVVRRHES